MKIDEFSKYLNWKYQIVMNTWQVPKEVDFVTESFDLKYLKKGMSWN